MKASYSGAGLQQDQTLRCARSPVSVAPPPAFARRLQRRNLALQALQITDP
ncbi:MAG: hypothetical protein WCQ21_13980 [Verrucomicrobiota bacterium]